MFVLSNTFPLSRDEVCNLIGWVAPRGYTLSNPMTLVVIRVRKGRALSVAQAEALGAY